MSTKIYHNQNNDKSMALSATRHATTPSIQEFQHLLSGIDSLDLGLFVTWGANWKQRLKILDKKKLQARKKGGLLISLPSGRTCIFKPGGKGENYRFHLQFEAYNLFIGKAAKPGSSPNVYLSINSKTLWLDGIETALSWIAEDIKAIGGGTIKFIQISRVDLCCDFFIPGGISYEFIRYHKVTRNKKSRAIFGKDKLETNYVGSVKSPIELRVYDKGVEVEKGGTKLWFIDLWKSESTENIWRVEIQLRRPALKQFGINCIDDLKTKKNALWQNLTTRWFSLRLPDNEKVERRTIHPFWQAVQNCFGQNTGNEIERIYRPETTAPEDWYLSHIDGCLSSLAALRGIKNRDTAINELQKLLNKRNNEQEFETACIKKAIQRGTLSKGDEL
ncbi:MAG: plasmid replication initiation factor [Smithella sp.]